MMTEDDLDGLFAAARALPPLPPAALTARVLADADAALVPNLAANPERASPPAQRGFWSVVAGVFGGGGAMAGMVSATVTGFYIGFAQPMDTGLVTLVLGGDTAVIDMMPGLDALLDEAP